MSDDTSAKQEMPRNTTQALRLINGSQQKGVTGAFTGQRRSWWLVVVAVALFAICAIGLMRRLADAGLKHSLQRSEGSDLAQELHSLTQSDLIQFSDGRIWYVRSVRGDNMEVVGWIGDNTRLEFIPSFVLSGDQFRIIRKSDPAWFSTRDKYLMQ